MRLKKSSASLPCLFPVNCNPVSTYDLCGIPQGFFCAYSNHKTMYAKGFSCRDENYMKNYTYEDPQEIVICRFCP